MRNRSWPHELCITHAIHCKLIEYKQTRRQRRSQVKAFKGWQYTEYIVQSQNCIFLMFSLKVMFTDKIILALMLFVIITSWGTLGLPTLDWVVLCSILLLILIDSPNAAGVAQRSSVLCISPERSLSSTARCTLFSCIRKEQCDSLLLWGMPQERYKNCELCYNSSTFASH